MTCGLPDISQRLASKNLRGFYRFQDEHSEYKKECKFKQFYHAYLLGYVGLDYIRMRSKSAYNLLLKNGKIVEPET